VFDVNEALKPEASKVHSGGNLAEHRKIRSGNVEIAFKKSEKILEDIFHSQKMQHCHMEPRAGIANVDASGKITIWSSLPVTFPSLEDLSRVLNLPITKIRIIQPECGGNFGGRNEISIEPIIAILALKTKRPVKIVWTREEEFIGSTTRHSYKMKYKTGFKKDGTIIARSVEIISDAGAYSSFGQSALSKSCILACGPYNIPNIKVDGYLIFTNHPVGGAMRGFGVPQHSVALTETILKAAEVAKWSEKQKTKKVGKTNDLKKGIGVACMIYPVGLTEKQNASSAIVKVNPDGTVNVHIGSLDVGQGSGTALSQIAAAYLGVNFDSVNIITGDTDSDPYDFGCCASRVTYTNGNAIFEAATKAKQMLLEVAAEKLAVNVNSLETKDGIIQVKGAYQKSVSISEAASISQKKGKPIITTGFFNPPNELLDPETGQGSPFPTYVYGTQIAEVEVDVKTGFVKVLKIIVAQDVGKALNHALLRGQLIGGVGFGIGQALLEQMIFKEGKNLNPNFLDYLIPTAEDMPEVDLIIVEEFEPTGPFGAKGISEAANTPTTPAILSAIYDAVGVNFNDLPVTPEKILKGLKNG